MEILTNEINEITNLNELDNILNLLYKYHNNFSNCIKETENELKNTENEYNIKLEHELIYKKHNEYYNYLGLDNLKLKDNENEIETEITDLLTELTNNISIIYLYELENFYNYGLSIQYFIENNYKININSYNHIILDNTKKEIYNLTQENETEILKRTLKENNITENETIQLYLLNKEYENTKIIIYNNLFEMDNYLLTINNCKSYNKEHNYIIIDLISNKWKTTNEIEKITLNRLIEILYNYDNELTQFIINNY